MALSAKEKLNRRSFLKASLVTGGAAALAACTPTNDNGSSQSTSRASTESPATEAPPTRTATVWNQVKEAITTPVPEEKSEKFATFTPGTFIVSLDVEYDENGDRKDINYDELKISDRTIEMGRQPDNHLRPNAETKIGTLVGVWDLMKGESEKEENLNNPNYQRIAEEKLTNVGLYITASTVDNEGNQTMEMAAVISVVGKDNKSRDILVQRSTWNNGKVTAVNGRQVTYDNDGGIHFVEGDLENDSVSKDKIGEYVFSQITGEEIEVENGEELVVGYDVVTENTNGESLLERQVLFSVPIIEKEENNKKIREIKEDAFTYHFMADRDGKPFEQVVGVVDQAKKVLALLVEQKDNGPIINNPARSLEEMFVPGRGFFYDKTMMVNPNYKPLTLVEFEDMIVRTAKRKEYVGSGTIPRLVYEKSGRYNSVYLDRSKAPYMSEEERPALVMVNEVQVSGEQTYDGMSYHHSFFVMKYKGKDGTLLHVGIPWGYFTVGETYEKTMERMKKNFWSWKGVAEIVSVPDCKAIMSEWMIEFAQSHVITKEDADKGLSAMQNKMIITVQTGD